MQQLKAGATIEILRHENQLLINRNQLIAKENDRLLKELESSTQGLQQSKCQDLGNIITNSTIIKGYLSKLNGSQFTQIKSNLNSLLQNSCINRNMVKFLWNTTQELIKVVIKKQNAIKMSILHDRVNTRKATIQQKIHFVKQPSNVSNTTHQEIQYLCESYQRILEAVKKPSISISNLHQAYEIVQSLILAKAEHHKYYHKISALEQQLSLGMSFCSDLPSMYETIQKLEDNQRYLKSRLAFKVKQFSGK